MKGMLDLLERAGIVRRVGEEDAAPAQGEPAEADSPPPAAEPEPASSGAAAAPALADSAGLSLEQIYARAGVPACAYPAERLLRLLDGLKAMDENTRRTTIQAIDAADDSWSIVDPMRDAAGKVSAIERHAAAIRGGVAQAEQQTERDLAELQLRQDTAVAEIRRQITDLEGLLAREIARGAQAAAALEAALQGQRQQARHELEGLTRAAASLTALMAQFGGAATASTPSTTGGS
jgi:hypothetical protein